MIDILSAEYVHDYIIELEFSDGNVGCYDLSSIIQKNTVLTNPLNNRVVIMAKNKGLRFV